MSPEQQAVRAFWRGVERLGWDAAVAWFRGSTPPCRREVADVVLATAFRANLDRISIGPRALTSNRRRPGVFE